MHCVSTCLLLCVPKNLNAPFTLVQRQALPLDGMRWLRFRRDRLPLLDHHAQQVSNHNALFCQKRCMCFIPHSFAQVERHTLPHVPHRCYRRYVVLCHVDRTRSYVQDNRQDSPCHFLGPLLGTDLDPAGK